MATCKDCLHLDVCYMVEHYGVDTDEDNQENDCHQFKDRTKWVEQKHGRWIDAADNPVPFDEEVEGCPDRSCYCNVCGDWLTASDEYCARGRFCPNCGADMRDGSVGE